MKHQHLDPEYARYRMKYPKAPEVEKCVELIGRSNVTGAFLDAVMADLSMHAKRSVAPVIAAFRAAADSRVRSLLLSVIAGAGASEALALFMEELLGPDESLRFWAARGLHRLDTHDARKALWQARSAELANATETAQFRQMLEEVSQLG